MPTNAINDTGVKYVYDKLDAKKVDKETGKGLSTNDYTTTEKNKVATIDNKADKVSGATNGNLAGLNSSGNPTDSGISGDMTTTSASGNPISIADLKSAQIALNPVVTFEPIQAGSGTPSPSNVRAISGYDKIEVSSCGKNLFDKDNLLLGIVMTGGQINTFDATWRRCYFPVVPNTTYVVTGISGQGYVYATYDQNGTWLETFANTGAPAIITTCNNVYYIALNCNTTNAASIQVEKGTSATTYVPYHKTTDLSESLGQTVYGGSLDVRTGKFTVDRAIYKVNASDITFNSSNYIITTSATSFKAVSADDVQNYISTHLKSHINSNVATMDNEFTVNSNKQIVIRMPNTITTDTQATNYFTNNDVYIVALLATPIEIQLTPHEIALSQGYNYISTNGTSISLAYHNGELASLSDVSQLGETVNEGLDYLKDYVEKNTIGSTPITVGTDNYITPSDGYLEVASAGGTDKTLVRINNIVAIRVQDSNINTVFIRKGLVIKIASGNGTAKFFPLV